MVLAKKLEVWDTIWIIVPSWPCTQEKYKEVKLFINFIESLWLSVKLADNFLKTDKFNISGWTAEECAHDFNSMVLNSQIQAIWCLQGGDTINQILELIDYDSLKDKPKIIIWKSDIDVLHNAIFSKIWLITFHWPDSKIWEKWEMEIEYSQKWFQERLFHGKSEIAVSNPDDRVVLVDWKWEGILIWCNLTSILKLVWTQYIPNFKEDFIFFIETYKEDTRGIIAKLEQLKILRIFERCKWVVIWSNFSFNETDWKAEDVISDFLKLYEIPVIKTNEFGHYQPHAFLPIGSHVSINTKNKEIKIISEFLL